MNPAWVHALVLVCVFGAVVLGVEAVVRWAARNREEGEAIHGRLKMIGRGANRGDKLNLLRRSGSGVPLGLPPVIDHFAHRIDRMLLQAQTRLETPRLLLILLIAPIALFFGLLTLMLARWGMSISVGRIIISATFACLLGAALPLFAVNWKATRTRKKIEEQFPV